MAYIAALLLCASAVNAQSDTVIKTRSDDIASLLAGGQFDPALFTENFTNAVPAAQLIGLRDDLLEKHGPLIRIVRLPDEQRHRLAFSALYRDASARLDVTLERMRPHRIAGLNITKVEAYGDTLDDVMQSMRALPGRTGFGVFALTEQAIAPQSGFAIEQRFAVASAFKLYVLAELDRAVRSGERRWSDVVRLGPKSHPSGILQDWPPDSEVTLQTLATLMISRSDNTATDTLIDVLGQDRLANIIRVTGHSQPSVMIPMLKTQHVSALKMPQNDDLRKRFIAGDDSAQTRLIARHADRLNLANIDVVRLTAAPLFVNDIEWFASPLDLARLLDYLHQHALPQTKQIMAINPGIGFSAARDYRYMGFKGGSNIGVLSLNFLVQKHDGQWLAVCAQWNDPANALEESQFIRLVTRAMTLMAQ